MDKLLLHPYTRSQINAMLKRPAGNLLLTAPAGYGKSTLARRLIADLLNLTDKNINSHPYFFVLIPPENKIELSIASVRELISNLKLKVPGPGTGIKRSVLIENAQNLSREAQNALLKLLEEPPLDTLIILCAPNENFLLPTVVSRVQTVTILAPGLMPTIKHFNSFPAKSVEANWRLAGGGPGLISALLTNESHPLKTAVTAAKDFLRLDRYNRIIYLQQLSKDKHRMAIFADALERVLSALQAELVKSDNRKNHSRLISARRTIDMLIKYQMNNTNPRLLSLMLSCELSV